MQVPSATARGTGSCPRTRGRRCVSELVARIDEALATARASEAAVMTVGAAAIDAAEQARRAAELAERASAAMLERSGPPPDAAPTAAGDRGRAEEDDSLRDFSARADRLAARLKELQKSEIPPVWGGRSAGLGRLRPTSSRAGARSPKIRHRPETPTEQEQMAVETAAYTEQTDIQRDITEMVRQFVDEQIIPNAEHYDHEDSFPEPIVEQMKELGLFGVTIPEEYGGMGLDLTTYAMIVEELSRGWISISGVVNTHFIGSYLLMKFGTDEQKDYFLPKMATGEIRAAFSLSEPEVGSDVQGIKSTAKKGDDGNWELNGQKMWVTNGLGSSVVFVLMKTDPKADPPYKGMTCFITEKEPWKEVNEGDFAGPRRPAQDQEDGLQGRRVDRARLRRLPLPARARCSAARRPASAQGFVQMMDALEVGRVNVAARGVGIAQRALELALRYSQERKTFGKPIAQHQAIQFKLADMATKIEAARLLTRKAARMKDAGERSDLEAGMAKLLASETGKECVEECFRIHGGYGYSKEYEIERLYRDAPLLLIGEGTSEIQRMVIGKKLLQRHKI